MRLIRALDEYVIEGIDTNIQMLKKILNHKNFVMQNLILAGMIK